MVLENTAHRLAVAGFSMLAAARHADKVGEDTAAVVLTEHASVMVERAGELRQRAARRVVRAPRGRLRLRWETV